MGMIRGMFLEVLVDYSWDQYRTCRDDGNSTARSALGHCDRWAWRPCLLAHSILIPLTSIRDQL